MEKRMFHEEEEIYVVDYWGSNLGMQAFEAYAKIYKVDLEKEIFAAVLYGDTCQTYSFKDYGRLIFDTHDEAYEAAKKIPKPLEHVYQKIDNTMVERTVKGITGYHVNSVYDLMICLDNGEEVSTKEIGNTIYHR